MKRNKRILGVLTAAALMIAYLPMSEADAAASASDFRMKGSTLVKYQGTDKNVTIPDTVKVIGRSAFEENKNIELAAISNSVEEIEAYAFWGCENLEGIGLGTGMSSVGDYVFSNCTSLEQVVLPSNITSIGVRAFEGCTGLTDITIPPETTDIHESAFDGCYRLKIHYEEGSPAEEYAKSFYERQKAMIPEGMDLQETEPTETNVPSESAEPAPTASAAPVETPALVQDSRRELGSTQVVGNKAVVIMDRSTLPVYSGDASPTPSPEGAQGDDPQDSQSDRLPKYAIVDGEIVADQAYYRSTKLEEVALSEGIREIGEFSYARSSATSVLLPEGVEHIGYGAFYHCDNLWKVSLPGTVRCVEPKAFSYTKWVQDFLNEAGSSAEDGFLVSGGVLVAYRGSAPDVTIPKGVRVIAGEAFRDHREIETVTLPDSLLVVGEGAFEGCSSLKQVSFGENVEEIKDRAFLGNVMSKISLPASVKKVGLRAFGDAKVSYQGEEAEETYETSATRLSNAAYRGLSDGTEQVSGVTVTGLETLFGSSVGERFKTELTSLSGADRGYTLKVSQPEDVAQMEAAFQRTFQSGIPGDMMLYDLELTDESEIPLLKLGKQTLSVVLPVPDALKGQEVEVYTLDNNGQLERLPVEILDVDGVEAVRFETNHPAMIGIGGVTHGVAAGAA